MKSKISLRTYWGLNYLTVHFLLTIYTSLENEIEMAATDSNIKPLVKLENQPDVSFHFNGVRKYYEYIFISERNHENLEVIEENGLLLFNKKIIYPFVSDKYMTSFSTNTTVPLKEDFSYRINLIEQNQYGIKTIRTGLKPPAASSFSPNMPKNTISKYYTL